jgi:luciferase family oxidoreductase group 1
LRLAVLDQSVATTGHTHGDAIRNTIALAEACEGFGYHRFWVSEHHSNPTIVGSAPEVLLGAIGARTKTIRIGSAGVMLPHYSPYKVAEQFRVLDCIAPGRIDLGLGRAPGSDGRTAFALNPLANERPAQFPNDVLDLIAWTSGGELREGHRFGSVKAFPAGDTSPEIWILGSSDYGAQVAAHFGLPYAFAWFFTDGRGGAEAIHLYRSLYKPSERFPEPVAGLCVWALAAESMEEARHHFASRARFRLMRDRGIFLPLDPPEIAKAYECTETERMLLKRYEEDAFIGTAEEVVHRIRALGDSLDIQDMAIVTWAYDEAARHTSYRLIAEEFRKTRIAAQAVR